jgi:hypothetical protein
MNELTVQGDKNSMNLFKRRNKPADAEAVAEAVREKTGYRAYRELMKYGYGEMVTTIKSSVQDNESITIAIEFCGMKAVPEAAI